MGRWFAKGRIFIGAINLAWVFVVAIPASAEPSSECTLATAVHDVHRLSELPPQLLRLVSPIAEVGAPFQDSDAITDPTLPGKQLVRAGSRGTHWFVWYKVGGGWHGHGGNPSVNLQAVIARVSPSGEMTLLASASMTAKASSNTLCSFTDGVFAGQVVPPYPQGTAPRDSLGS